MKRVVVLLLFCALTLSVLGCSAGKVVFEDGDIKCSVATKEEIASIRSGEAMLHWTTEEDLLKLTNCIFSGEIKDSQVIKVDYIYDDSPWQAYYTISNVVVDKVYYDENGNMKPGTQYRVFLPVAGAMWQTLSVKEPLDGSTYVFFAQSSDSYENDFFKRAGYSDYCVNSPHSLFMEVKDDEVIYNQFISKMMEERGYFNTEELTRAEYTAEYNALPSREKARYVTEQNYYEVNYGTSKQRISYVEEYIKEITPLLDKTILYQSFKEVE